MLLKYVIVAAICGATLASVPAFGQEDPVSKAEIGIEAPVYFVENTSSDETRESVSADYGLPGRYHFFFNKRRGGALNSGYTHNTQTYSLDSASVEGKGHSDEVVAAHAFQFPAKHWSAAVLAEGLVFDPRRQTWLGYGRASDSNLTHRIFPRAEHRGVFYNSVTLNIDRLNKLDWFTNHEEPAIVFGYNF